MSSKHSLSGRLFVGIDKGKRRISRYAPSFFSIVQFAGHTAYHMEQDLNLIVPECLRQHPLTANRMQEMYISSCRSAFGSTRLQIQQQNRRQHQQHTCRGGECHFLMIHEHPEQGSDDRLDRSQD